MLSMYRSHHDVMIQLCNAHSLLIVLCNLHFVYQLAPLVLSKLKAANKPDS